MTQKIFALPNVNMESIQFNNSFKSMKSHRIYIKYDDFYFVLIFYYVNH